jgi:hypothetical protein
LQKLGDWPCFQKNVKLAFGQFTPIYPMKFTPSCKILSLLAVMAFAAGTGHRADLNTSAAAPAAAAELALDVSEVSRIERLFSSGSHWTRPAPAVWSSRFEVRWNARWANSPRFAV